jgi:deoxyribodipyrimidine photo-lyase
MKDYGKARDFPATEGTSGLSVHLRFGTISIRECVRKALAQQNAGASTWLSELVWRDFYHMILDHNPHVETGAFKKEYDSIKWPGSEKHFQAWCEGRTGYPIIDAAMRHFNATGWMHNRLRMVVASFLTKDLLVSWQKGEAYFAAHLLDFDLAANNGGWQWSASTGCDAQPYFRVFNPYSQSEKFDPDGAFIRENVEELAKVKGKDIHQPDVGGLFGVNYPEPIVDHSVQREKAIRLFKK